MLIFERLKELLIKGQSIKSACYLLKIHRSWVYRNLNAQQLLELRSLSDQNTILGSPGCPIKLLPRSNFNRHQGLREDVFIAFMEQIENGFSPRDASFLLGLSTTHYALLASHEQKQLVKTVIMERNSRMKRISSNTWQLVYPGRRNKKQIKFH